MLDKYRLVFQETRYRVVGDNTVTKLSWWHAKKVDQEETA